MTFEENNNPLVSIIIQTFNRRNLVPIALDSAKNQTYKNIEILVGDNHSTDGTEDYFKEQQQYDNRIRYFRHETNIGMAGNANFLLSKVQGKYFIWLNDDDWLDADYVEKCIDAFRQNPDYSFVAPCRILYNEERKVLKRGEYFKLDYENPADRVQSYFINMFEDVVSGTFRTDILKDIKELNGKYLSDLYAEDLLFMMRYLIKDKALMLESTHMNKLENGRTRILKDTPKDIFNVKGIKESNYFDTICRNALIVAQKENFTKKYLTNEEIKNVADSVKYALIRVHKLGKVYGKFHKLLTCIKIKFFDM